MKIKENMNIFTIRKKILLASKLIGVVLIISYVLSTKLPMDTDISFVIWLAFVVVLVCAIDLLMARFITKPVSELNEAARNMAELNFSHPCHVESHDEFGELAESLNKMAENLQQAFSSLEGANRKLEQDVEQKKRLLAERKELVDNLSHEMKTPLGVIRAYAEGLQDETDEAKRQKYSEVIITETERMSRLITTLLDLSALENGATQLRPERFDFVDFLETVAGRLLIDTPDADFVLEYELPEHPVCLMESVDLRMDVHMALERLPQELREVTILYFFQEVRQKEIARILGIGLPLVKYRIKRAKELLTIYLGKEDFE